MSLRVEEDRFFHVRRALHYSDYHFDANFDKWVKSGLLVVHEDNDAEGAFEDVLAPKHVPTSAAPFQATHPSSDINVAILDILYSLSNNIWGFRYEVNTRLSSLEMQMTSLLAHHPLSPPFFPSDDN
ncbi:hypothetical protein PVK06_020827 [Gossypium arboreum]|uniref:Uncharacterized protein n=1 Tax=Gossypium arboreum TaxID=29729 RepID=A0ABR0PNV1_GOSAR|nr:hypothetical protein PVK06_020827 [Gossypium arboreum]